MKAPDPQDYEQLTKEELVERLRALQSDSRLQGRLPETERLIHELQVHQVELEMQNRELRETQAQLLESSARYADLYDFAPAAYCTLDRQDRIVEANLSAAALFGIERASLIGRRLSSLVPAASRMLVRDHVSRCFTARSRGTLELTASFRRGEPVVVQLASMPVVDAGGKVTACRALLSDISALKRTENMLGFLATASAALASSLQDEAAIANVADRLIPAFADACLVDVVDADGSVRRIQATGGDSRQTGSRRAGAPVAVGLDESTVQAEVLRTGKPLLIADVEEPARSVSKLDASLAGARSVICVPLLSQGRKLGALTLAMIRSGRGYQPADLDFARDVASRIATAIESARLYRHAQQAAQAREAVLAVVSHDLRTPVSSILLAARTLEDSVPSMDSVVSRTLGAIKRAVERMDRMIEDLLDVSSIDAGRLALDQRDYEVTELIQDAFDSLKALVREKNVEFSAQRPLAGTRVLCDRERILQVFSNLIGNAIKFTPQGGSISIAAQPREADVQFLVQDSGPGIDRGMLPHLFERYSQATATAGRGRGLGLYICKGIVQAHGGRIWVESAPQSGTKVFFTLPRPADATAKAGGARRPRPGTVLVVDDDEAHRLGLRMLLEAAGYAVEEAQDGLDALDQTRSRKPLPVLIVLDLQMPRMDGWDLMVELKKDPALASIPVVLVSGYSRLGAEAEAIGADGYVRKPVRPEQLLETVERCRGPTALG